MKRFALLALTLAAGLASAAEPRVYALVSAVGSELHYVRQRQQVGSNLEPYQRFTIQMPDASIDVAVLRGLERWVRKDDPEARVVQMRLKGEEVRGVLPYKRGEVLVGKLATALERMPERAGWDRIVLVTPRYVQGTREGLGTKLHGVGVFVQPLEQSRVWRSETNTEFLNRRELGTVAPDGTRSESKTFVAPYFYAKVWVLDARTLTVLETDERFDFQRIFDPKSAGLNVELTIPVEKLAEMVERFVERASARELEGEVTVKERGAVK